MTTHLCSNCKAVMPANVRFCVKCGTKVQSVEKTGSEKEPIINNDTICVCGSFVPVEKKFCTKCGVKINHTIVSIVKPHNFAKKNNTDIVPNIIVQKPKKKKKIVRNIILVVAFLVVGLFIAGVIGNYIDGRSKNDVFGPDTDAVVDISGILNLKTDTKSSFGIQSAELSIEKPILQHEGVSLNIEGILSEEKLNAKIEKLKPEDEVEGIYMQAYEFTVENSAKLSGVYEITIPYETHDLNMQEHSVGAAWLNPATSQWEAIPFLVDEKSKSVVISTNHLSAYSSFVIKNEYRPNAQLTDIFGFSTIGVNNSQYEKVLIEMIDNNMQPGPSAAELGFGVFGEWFSFAGASLNTYANVYDDLFLDNLNSLSTNMGAAMAFLNVSISLYNGDKLAAVSTALRERLTYAVGTWGTRAMQLGFVGVFFIDYSINSMFKEAISDREKLWEEAYRLFYVSKENYRTRAEWKNLIVGMQNKASNVNGFHQMLDDEFNLYVNAFWQDETKMAYYFSEVKKGGFTGGGGLNEALKKKISSRFKYDLLSMHLIKVFEAIELEYRYNQQKLVREYLQKMQTEMNKRVFFEIVEVFPQGSKPKYAGYKFRFAPLSSDVKEGAWQSKLNKSGSYSGSFTVLGHMMSGAPSKIELYAPNATVPEISVPFKIEFPKTIIQIISDGEEEIANVHEDDKVKKFGFFTSSKSFSGPSNFCILSIDLMSGGWVDYQEGGEITTDRIQFQIATVEDGIPKDLAETSPPYSVTFLSPKSLKIDVNCPPCSNFSMKKHEYFKNHYITEYSFSQGSSSYTIHVKTKLNAAFKGSYTQHKFDNFQIDIYGYN